MKTSVNTILSAAVIGAILTLSATSASASVGNLTINKTSLQIVKTDLHKNFEPVDPTETGYSTVAAGIRSVSLDKKAAEFVFCIQPAVGLDALTGNYSQSLVTSSISTSVKQLYEVAYASTLSFYSANITGSVAQQTLAKSSVAAFQLALWELKNDDGSLSTGDLSFSGSYADALTVKGAGALLKAASTYQIKNIYNYSALTSTTPSQTLLTVSAVPEPETYAMMLAGLGLVGFMARRRKAA